MSVQRPLLALSLPLLALCALACGGFGESEPDEPGGEPPPAEVAVPAASHAVLAPMLWFASFGTPGGQGSQLTAAVESCGREGTFAAGEHGYAVMEITRDRVRLGDTTIMALVGGRPLASQVDQGLVIPVETALERMSAANQQVRHAGCSWQPLAQDTLLVAAGKNLPSSTVEMLTGTAQALGWATLMQVSTEGAQAQPEQLAGPDANPWRLQLSFEGDAVVAEELGPISDYTTQLSAAPPAVAELSVNEGISWDKVSASMDGLYGAGVPCITLVPTGEQLPDLPVSEPSAEGKRLRSPNDKVAVMELSAYPWEDGEEGEWALAHGLQCRWSAEPMSGAVLQELGLKKSTATKSARSARSTRAARPSRRSNKPTPPTRIRASSEPAAATEPVKTAPVGQATVRSSALKLDRGDEAAVNSVLRGGLSRVKSCYEIGLRDNPTTFGTMVVLVTVGKRTSTGSVQVRRGLERGLDRCVEKELAGLSYPSDRRGYTATWTLAFTVE